MSLYTDLIWPSQLPQCFEKTGFLYSPQSAVLRTQMDAGIDKVRNRFTSAPWTLAGNMVVSYEQKNILDQFFELTLFNGSLPFLMKDPLPSDVQYIWRFLAPPSYSVRGWDSLFVQIQLERLPAGAIYPDPTVTVPVYVTGNEGGSVTVTAIATYATWYQWYWNGEAIPGAVSSSYTKTSIQREDHLGTLTVEVGNPASKVMSNEVELRLSSPYFSLIGEDADNYYEQIFDPDNFGAISDHTDSIFAFDFDNEAKEFLADEPVWGNGYFVQNLEPYSNHVPSSYIGTGNGAICYPQENYMGKDCIAVYFDESMSSGAWVRLNADQTIPMKIGSDYVFTFDVVLSRKLTGSEVINVRYTNCNSIVIDNVAGGYNIIKNQTAQWQRMGRYKTNAGQPLTYFEAFVTGTLTAPLTIYIADRQVQEFTSGSGTSNTAVGWFLPTNGAVETKVFGQYPNNTIDGNTYLVTIDYDQPTTIGNGGPYLKHVPEITNYAIESYCDDTTEVWAGSNFIFTDDGVSVICSNQHSWKHQNNAVGYAGKTTEIIASGVQDDPYTIQAIIQEGDSPNFSLAVRNQTDATFLGRITYVWSTGDVNVINTNGTVEYTAELLQTGVCKLTLSAKGVATDVGDVINGWIYPNQLASNSYYSYIHYAAVFQASLGEVRDLGPIYTDGATVTQPKTDYQIPLMDKVSSKQGMWAVDIEVERGDITADVMAANVLRLHTSDGNTGILYWHGGNSNGVTYDGTDTSNTATTIDGRFYMISAFDYDYDNGNGILRFGGDGAWDGSPAYFDGEMNLGGVSATYRVCAGNNYPQKLYAVDYYGLPYSDAKTVADVLLGIS